MSAPYVDCGDASKPRAANGEMFKKWCCGCNDVFYDACFLCDKYGVVLCARCYVRSNYRAGISSSEFRRVEPVKVDWTDKETLRLLEAIVHYGDDWQRITKHVGGRTVKECTAHYMALYFGAHCVRFALQREEERWLSWNRIHECKFQQMSGFFNEKSPTKNPSIYKYYRNAIVKKFRANPSRKITFTEVRRNIVGDVGSIRQVFDFLETWGLINYSPSPKQPLMSEETESKSSSAAPLPTPAVGDVIDSGAANGETSKKRCDACETVCTVSCFVYDEYDMVLCARCYVGGNYIVSITPPSEFRRVAITEPVKTDWTYKETMYLLEAIMHYGDDWNCVAKHVGGRTEKECAARFIELPFGEQFMELADQGWFSWIRIHEQKDLLMSGFFDGKPPSENPSIYKYYRNAIVEKFRENPSRKITFTEVRRTLFGEVSFIRRVFDFLETWGLINNSPSAKHPLRWEGRQSKSSYAAVVGPMDSGADNDERSLKWCSGCKAVCTVCSFVSDKHNLVLCARCYVRNNFRPGISSSEFRRLENSEPVNTDWTDRETLHLLEAIMHYGDDWKCVAKHVGGRSEKECVAHFNKLPFGEQFMKFADQGWFSWNRIHECKVRQMSVFFNEMCPSQNPSVYQYYRDAIIKKSMANPSRKITFTEVRKTIVGDNGSISRVFDFLETWGLINHSPWEKYPLTCEGGESTSSSTGAPSTPTARDANNFGAANGGRSKTCCNGCKAVCTIASFVSDKYDLVLCARCYVRGNYRVGISSSDFRRVAITEPMNTYWTDIEILSLLEAIVHFGGDWKRVAEHVGGRTENECVARFMRRPFGERLIELAD